MRGGAFAGVALATVCGVLTAFATFQPLLAEEKQKKEGTFQERTSQDDQSNVISNAIKDTIKDGLSLEESQGGFAWGIRKTIRKTFFEEKQPVKPSITQGEGQKEDGK